MKKKTVGLLVLIMTLCLVSDVFARTGSRRSTIRVYGTTGGQAGDLDAIECEDIRGDDAATTDPLRDDDVAWGIITTAGAHPQIYFWAFDEDVDETNCTGANEPWDFCTGSGTGTFAEDDPRLILPDDIADCTVTANEGAWVLGETYYLGRVDGPTLVFRDAKAADTDDNAYWAITCTDCGSGTEDIDAVFYVQIAGTPTAIITIDADGRITFGLATALAADSIDAITEIAAALKAGADGTLLTGTAGTDTYVAVWNADGDLVDGPGVPYVVGGTDVSDADVANNITIDLATLASTVTVVDGTDATSYVAIFDSATGSLAPKTDAGISYNASTGLLGVTAMNTNTLIGETAIGDPGGFLLSDDNYVELDATADGMDDDEYNGVVIGGRNCGESLTQWDLVEIVNDADPWHKADATAASGEYPAFGISVAACTDTNEARILVKGIVRNEGWTGLTPGAPIYLGETDGALTETAPSTSNDAVQIVGWVLTDSEIYFDFSRPYQLVE